MILKKGDYDLHQRSSFMLDSQQKIILQTNYLKRLTGFQQNDIYQLSIKLSYK